MNFRISLLSNSAAYLSRDLRIFSVIALILTILFFNPGNILTSLVSLIMAIAYFALAQGISKNERWAWICGLILFSFLIITGLTLFLFKVLAVQNLILNLLVPFLFLVSFVHVAKLITGNTGIYSLSFFVVILGLVSLFIIQPYFIYTYGYVPRQFTQEIDLNSFDASQCFKTEPKRHYSTPNNWGIQDKLEYIVKDDKGNYLQDLLMLNYVEAEKASSEFAERLTDPSCKFVECKGITINGLSAARVKRENNLYKEEGKAYLNTSYYVTINKLSITASSNGYTWEESDENAKSAIKCVTSLLHK